MPTSEQAMKASQEIARNVLVGLGAATAAEIIDAAFAPVWLDKPDGGSGFGGYAGTAQSRTSPSKWEP